MPTRDFDDRDVIVVVRLRTPTPAKSEDFERLRLHVERSFPPAAGVTYVSAVAPKELVLHPYTAFTPALLF